MGQYYFIHSALPELKLGCPTKITFQDILQLFYDNFSHSDRLALDSLLTFLDLTNVYYYLTNQPLDPKGRLSVSEIEDSLVTFDHFPSYLVSYLQKYTEDKTRIQNFSEVYLAYFQQESVNSSEFMRNYLKFERNLRLYLAKMRAVRFGRKDLIPSSNEEHLVIDEFEELKRVLLQVEGSPLEEYQIIQKYRFDALQTIADRYSFDASGLFAYLMQWLIVEEDIGLDEEQGTRTIQKLLEVSA